MKAVVVTIADHPDVAKAIDLYLRIRMADRVDSYFMTYRRTLLSGPLMRQTDLFIMDLLATDAVGPYAQGIFAAEKWMSFGKRALVVSGSAFADVIDSALYWDLAATVELANRVTALLESAPGNPVELDSLKAQFRAFYRPPIDPHFR